MTPEEFAQAEAVEMALRSFPEDPLAVEVRRLRAVVETATADVALCGICKLGGRILHINDDCSVHGDNDEECW